MLISQGEIRILLMVRRWIMVFIKYGVTISRHGLKDV
jgi:hypothetical protein